MRNDSGHSEGHERSRKAAGPEAGTPVLDFSDRPVPAARDLGLVLTARFLMDQDEPVWVRRLPERSWEILHAMGLAHLFQPFPVDESHTD